MPNIVEIVVVAKNATKEGFAAASAESESFGAKLSKVGAVGGLALAGVAAASVKMAADFQSATTRLVTSAGETDRNLAMVRQGLLDMAGQVGVSATELAKGMYTVESAGFHGAAGLVVLKAAAQGAKDENADLSTVANAVTDALTDYHLKASDSASVTSKLVTAVSYGKTTFQDFSQALSNVLPLAGSLHLSIADVSGVLAEMTAHGMSAERASQNEANAMRELIAPNNAMVKEFGKLGISSDEISKKLSTQGLSGTLEWLRQVADKVGPSVGQQPVEAFKKLLGSSAALSVGLMVTGENAKATNTAIKGIGKATTDSAGNVKGFSEIQATFKQRLSEVTAQAESMAIEFGNKLMPAVSAVLGWMSSHQGIVMDLAKAIGIAVAALAAYAVVAKTVAIAQKVLNLAMDMNPFVAIGIAVVAIAAVVIKYHKQIWDFIQKIWNDVSKFVAKIWGDIYSFAKQWWLLILGPAGLIIKYHNDIWKFIQRIWNDILGFFKRIWGDIEGFFRNTLSSVERVFTNGWNSISRGAQSIMNGLLSWIRGLPGRFVSALSNLASDFANIGKTAINALWNGLKSAAANIGNWISNFAGGIVKIFKKIWGWFSPSSVMFEGGKSLMEGLANGIKAHAHKAQSAAAGVANQVANVGSGVTRWTPLVQQALRMEGLPLSLTAQVLRQISSESGGNPNAINLTDSNAAAGDPSRGLLQTIMSTFQAYHWSGTSNNIYDPLANIAAAINYARHVYGPNLMRNGSGLGSGHGYAAGGPAGGLIAVGEHGMELVKVPGGSTVYPHGASAAMMSGSGGLHITLELGDSFRDAGLSAQQIRDIKYTVRAIGGGNVQNAFGKK